MLSQRSLEFIETFTAKSLDITGTETHRPLATEPVNMYFRMPVWYIMRGSFRDERKLRFCVR